MTAPSALALELALQGHEALQAGRYDQASQYFTEALEHAPSSDALHYHYASACAWRGMPTEALAALDRCMALGGPWHDHAARLAQQIRQQQQEGWDKDALGVVGAAAIGEAIGVSGASDEIAEDITMGADDILE